MVIALIGGILKVIGVIVVISFLVGIAAGTILRGK